MGTRSYIGIKNEDNSVDGVYAHWDGYLSNNGMILEHFYQDESKIRELISLGDISSLKKLVNAPEGVDHSLECQAKDVTVFWHRDRGEEFTPPYHFVDEDDFWQTQYKFLYLYKKGSWLVKISGNSPIPLADALDKDEESVQKKSEYVKV